MNEKILIEVTESEKDEIVQALHLSAQDDQEHLFEYGLSMKDVKAVLKLAKEIERDIRTPKKKQNEKGKI